jgi:hypothetical protein
MAILVVRIFLFALHLSCYFLSIFPSHKTKKCWTFCYKFLFLYILSLCLWFHLRILLTLLKYLVAPDVYCCNVHVVCVTKLKLLPFQYIPFSFWMMYFYSIESIYFYKLIRTIYTPVSSKGRHLFVHLL